MNYKKGSLEEDASKLKILHLEWAFGCQLYDDCEIVYLMLEFPPSAPLALKIDITGARRVKADKRRCLDMMGEM